MSLFSMIALLCVISSCHGGRRDNVKIRGTTTRPGFEFIFGNNEPAHKCDPMSLAMDDGKVCCRDFLRNETCPGYEDHKFVKFSDPETCCKTGNLEPCSRDVCYSHLPSWNITCPESHPVPIAHGSRCCKGFTRTVSCPTGNIGEFLEVTDPVECCPYRQVKPCRNQRGQWSTCAPKNRETCPDPPVIHSHDPYYWHDYPPGYLRYHPKNTLLESCEHDSDYFGYYVTLRNERDVGFVIDMGCSLVLDKIILKNTKNRFYNNRATLDFVVHVSSDLASWTEIVRGRMANLWHRSCDKFVPEVFQVSTHARGRYLRFRMLSYSGVGGGLNYINWIAL